MVTQYAVAFSKGKNSTVNIDQGLICRGAQVIFSGALNELDKPGSVSNEGVFLGLANGAIPGEAGKECASGMVNELMETFKGVEDPGSYRIGDAMQKLEQGLKRVHELLLQLTETREDDTQMIGCLAGAWVTASEIIYTSVGNTRIYRFSDGVLQLMTEDDTEVWELVNAGKINPDQVHTYPGHKVFTQVLGGVKKQKPRFKLDSQKVEAGDVFLLCSAGLSQGIKDQTLEKMLNGALNAEGIVDSAIVDRIVEQAAERNELEDCSLVLFQMFPKRSRWTTMIDKL
jgi:serine/threonine protein phosphatase PrpC